MHNMPMAFDQLIEFMLQLSRGGNTRLSEQLAYHLSITVTDDLLVPIRYCGRIVALASAKYILINSMQTIGIIR